MKISLLIVFLFVIVVAVMHHRNNGSTLLSLFPLIRDKTLSDVDLTKEDLKNITSKLDSNKAHGDDMISIRKQICYKHRISNIEVIPNRCDL